jgi:thioredoxin reductase/bacterioferritin-associated ferredoxin
MAGLQAEVGGTSEAGAVQGKGVTRTDPAVATVELTFEGRTISARRGESLAAALTAAGVLDLREAKVGPRGLFCGMGVCQDCVMTIDGLAGQRACMTTAVAGQVVTRRPASGQQPPSTGAPPILGDDLDVRRPDLLVIGGGIGGLTAALAARQAGLDVLLVDERPTRGGQYFKQAAEALGMPPIDAQQQAGSELLGRVTDAGVSIVHGEVWGAFAADRLAAVIGGRSVVLGPRAVLVATGAFERVLPRPGWTLPGVMTTGAAQTLWRSYRRLPGRRVLVAGNGPLNLQVALELAAGGATIVGLAEAASGLSLGAGLRLVAADPLLAMQGLGSLAAIARRRIPLHRGTRVLRIDRRDDGLVATLGRHLAGKWLPTAEVETDIVAIGEGFLPANEILRALGAVHDLDTIRGTPTARRSAAMETTVENLFAVGDCCGLGGAPAAAEEAIIAAAAIADRLGRPSPALAKSTSVARRRLARHRQFQAALWEVFSASDPGLSLADPATLICRCEEVDRQTLEAAVDDGATSIGDIKRRTRCGMGRCQGRYCAPVLAAMLTGATGSPLAERDLFAPRAPVKPVLIGALVAAARQRAES